MTEAKLTTTSYAVLGLLAMQPWTMYALAQEMRRNIRYFYPRAESRLYEEPKRLEALGLVRSQRAKTGARTTTTYVITPAGRAELRRWLSKRVAKGPALEFEGLLRVFLAPFGREADLRNTLAEVREEIAGLIDLAGRIAGEYEAGSAPFQRYAPTRAMVHDFLSGFALFVDGWAERSLARIGAWETMNEAERNAAAIAAFRRNARRPTPAALTPPAPRPARRTRRTRRSAGSA
jgi:DNA-binding PadR family transcriptional regulator